jgi:LysM repeat protein
VRGERCCSVTRLAVFAAVAALAAPAGALAGVNPQIAGLQVALRAHGLYLAQIDGIAGARTAAAVHAFQRQHHLPVGTADTRTRIALGPLGRPLFGSRVLKHGDFGLDVSVLQFLLTRRGVYTAAALKHYQRLMHLSADSVVGPRTLSAIVSRDRVPVRTPIATAVTSTVHVVRVGDTLTAIAKKAGTTIAAIASLNHIDPRKPILIGQRLRVPARTAGLAATQSNVRERLDAWSARLGVDQHLVRALAWMESGYQTRIVSSAGARGVLQTLPTTREYVENVLAGRRIPRTVDGDIEVGILYLRHLLQVFHGNQSLALAGWYQGERAVRERGVYNVSKPFVANVLALKLRM